MEYMSLVCVDDALDAFQDRVNIPRVKRVGGEAFSVFFYGLRNPLMGGRRW